MKFESMNEYRSFFKNKNISVKYDPKHYSDYKGTGRKLSFISSSGIEYVFHWGGNLFEIVIPHDIIENKKELIFEELSNF